MAGFSLFLTVFSLAGLITEQNLIRNKLSSIFISHSSLSCHRQVEAQLITHAHGEASSDTREFTNGQSKQVFIHTQ